MSQAQQRQQITHQDSQVQQRQIMLRQWQELQKHRQFPTFADGSQQNSLNQQSENFMFATSSFMPTGASAAVQGFPTGSFLPGASSMNNYNLNCHLQVSNNEAERHAMQSLYGKPYLGVNQNNSQGPSSFTNVAFQSKQSSEGKNLLGQVQDEGFQLMNSLLMNASAQEFNSRLQQRDPPEQIQQKLTTVGPSQGAATLDPLEQKILFDIEGPGTTLQCSDYLSSFPSIESGSWSALMQTAVAESSSDHGPVQEEWSGLGFHNLKLSMNNQHSDWVDNSDVSAIKGIPQASSGATHTSPGFPGFQILNQNRKVNLSYPHSSLQSSQQGQSVLGSQLNHMMQPPLGNSFPFQGFQFSGCNAERTNVFTHSQNQMSIPPSFGSSYEPRVQQESHNIVGPSTGSVFTKNQHQMYLSSADVRTQTPQETSPTVENKLSPFKLFIPQDATQSSFSLDPVAQQFPLLEAAAIESSRGQPPPLIKTSSQQPMSVIELQELPSNSQFSPNPRALPEVFGQSGKETGIHHSEPVAKNHPEETGVTRKRKSKSDLKSWQIEVTKNSTKPQTLSTAEVNWARALNRLPAEVDNEGTMNDCENPSLGSNKRLTLTTQLAQLLFTPAPAAALHVRAATSSDDVAYICAKQALEEACNMSLMAKESKSNEENSEKNFPTVVENFTTEAKKMEANFSRFEKSKEMSDIIVEAKEIEKIAIQNRCARFHVRRHRNQAEPKPAPERYVVAVKGRPIPEDADCLRL